jgi:magnesium transporter
MSSLRFPQSVIRRSTKTGLPPGTLAYVGDRPEAGPVKLTLIDYDEEQLVERETGRVEECFPFLDMPPITWLNVDGVHQVEVIEKIGQHLSLHPLLLEDLVNTRQRPKLEDYEGHLFIVLKMLIYDESRRQVLAEQVAMVLGPDYLISFEEDPGDVFDQVRTRLRIGAGRLRKAGPDYLAYSLIDAIVDNYFNILEVTGEDIADLEEELASDPRRETLQTIYRLKREMIALRRAVWPLREVLGALQRAETPLIQPGTQLYLRDVYDHTIQIIDAVESMRDLLAGMLDIYLSGTSNRLNEIMKVLTVFSAIFIPLTFLAGVYGMNFKYFPEIGWRWGYLLFWLMAITIIVLMLVYFRRKRWI